MDSRSGTETGSLSNLSNGVCSFSFTSISLNFTNSGFLFLFHRQESTQFFVHFSSGCCLGSGNANARLLISSAV